MFKDSNFDSEYRPSKNVSIDEAMIPFKGRLSLKQYMPLKPVKRGIKVWECADSSNGFVCDLEVYTGKQRNGNPEQGLGHRVVKFFVDVSEEVKAFFALNILFGIKQLPEVYSYWSRNQLLGVPEVEKIFPRNHFAKISQYLHLNGN